MLDPLVRVLNDAPGTHPNRYRVKLFEMMGVLGGTAIVFFAFQEDMQTFGYFVYLGMVYMVFTCAGQAGVV